MSICVIDSESLTDQLWLNPLDQAHVQIEHEPTSDTAQYHHVFFIRQPEDDSFSSELQKRLKSGWYSFSIGSDSVSIIYHDQIFSYPTIDKSLIFYKDAIEHGLQQGIQEEFLDFPRYLTLYAQLINQFERREE